MTKIIKINVLKKKYIDDIATNARQSDLDEYYGLGDKNFKDGVTHSVLMSDECYCFVDANDRVIAMYGVVKATAERKAVIWEVGTDLIEKHRMSFLRQSKRIIKRWVQRYGPLTNSVGAWNNRTKEWLLWLGAKFGMNYEVYGNYYTPFIIERKE